MTTTRTPECLREISVPNLPDDWTEKDGLISLVMSAVEAVDWPDKQKCFSIPGGQQFTSEMLMALLTYCYATGIYSSQDIEASIRENKLGRSLCVNTLPDWKTLRRFRKLHREPLKKCLLNVIHQALLIRFGESDEDRPPADYSVAQALDRWFEPLCVASPTTEAEERLNRACFIDGMAIID